MAARGRWAWTLAVWAGYALACDPVQASDTVVRSFVAGAGPQDVGLTASESGQDREEDGPQALTSDASGQLFLLDQVNDRILTFDPAKPATPQKSLTLPRGIQPTDLVVKKDAIYVWDGRVHALQALGPAEAPTRGLAETRSGEPIDEFTRTAFEQVGSDPSGRDQGAPDSPDRAGPAAKKPVLNRQSVETGGRGPVVVDVAMVERGAGALLDVRAAQGGPVATKLSLRVAGRLGSIAFLNIDRGGRMFVLAEDIPEMGQGSAFAFVARYSAKGIIEGVYDLPLAQTANVSRRSVTVSPDGDVYFLKASRKTVEVIGLGFRPIGKTKIVTAGRTQPNPDVTPWVDSKGIGMAVGPLTRQRVVQTAYAFEGVRWTVNLGNYGPEQDQLCTGFNGRIRRPMYMIGKQSQDVQGVPYCWGCQGSLAQFMSRIKRGSLAGNVCTRDTVRTDAAGVDCSSFVSAAWGLSTHFTTAAIPAIASRVENPWDLQPGDALDKPGSHVVLFLGFTPDRQASVMEASTGGCQGRVCRNVYPLSSLLARGYIPVRYRALINAGSQSPSQANEGSVAQ